MIRITFNEEGRRVYGEGPEDCQNGTSWSFAGNVLNIYNGADERLVTYLGDGVSKVERIEPGKCEACGK